jgi:ABC-type multidrug transport system ATPase subunit
MNEQLLRSILRLYALLAGSDGILDEEKQRIEEFLRHHLSGRSVARFLEILEQWSENVQKEKNNPGWLDKQLEKICQSVNKELLLAQKFYLYLELTELSAVDGQISSDERYILSAIPKLLNLPEADVQALSLFATGNHEVDFDANHVLLISNQKNPELSKSDYLEIPEMEGLVVVLKLPSVDCYFVRLIGQAESYLNGQIMVPGMSRIWAPGTTFRQEKCDPIYFNFIQERFSAPVDKPRISFEAKGLEYKFDDGRIGLRNIHVSEKGGRMVAIMGASGCGKSTLFNVLNGNEKPDKGSVLINGVNVHKEPDKLEGVIGYIPQDDLLNERLTVFQNMYFAARFSFGNWAEKDIVEISEKTLHSLGLSETRDKEVGSPSKKTISGGQRKRLNIGLELIRQPSVLFVDEPTSGLSSSDSLRTMELLKNLALNGKLVFVIIHQPSPEIFKMFDRLMVMDNGGHTIYYGNPLEAVPYFRREANLPPVQDPAEVANSAEIFDIVETKLVSEMGTLVEERKFSPADWAARYQQHFPANPVKREKEEVPHHINTPGFLQQIGLYFRRDILAKIRDHQYMFINLLEAPVLALLLAIVVRYAPTEDFIDKPYHFSSNENIPAYFFMSVIVALFMGLSVSAEEIIRDRLLLKREKFLHLNRDSYLIAKILLLFCLSAIHTLAFVMISDFVLEVDDIGPEFWMVLFSTSCCANMLGLALSDTFKNAVVVYILIPLLLIPQLVLGGVVIQYDRVNPVFGNPGKVPLIGEMMVSRWAYEALMVAQFKNNSYQKVTFESEARKEEYHYKRTYYLKELSEILQELHNLRKDDSLQSENIRIKKDLLFKELSEEGANFNLPSSTWEFVKGEHPFPENKYQMVQDQLKKFGHFYSAKYRIEERILNQQLKIFEDPITKKNMLANVKIKSENEQVREIVANDMMMQKKFEVSKSGIYRKVKPIYHFPKPSSSLDFRTHFYAPVKLCGGLTIPTEIFNLFIIWMFTLLTAVVLRFSLLKKLFRLTR